MAEYAFTLSDEEIMQRLLEPAPMPPELVGTGFPLDRTVELAIAPENVGPFYAALAKSGGMEFRPPDHFGTILGYEWQPTQVVWTNEAGETVAVPHEV